MIYGLLNYIFYRKIVEIIQHYVFLQTQSPINKHFDTSKKKFNPKILSKFIEI